MVEANIRPVHPGEMLREDLLEPLGLNGALSAVLNERAALSSEMAYRFEKAFGVKTDFLLRVQARYDALIAQERYADIDIQRYVAA
jgi:antitoxin HigA-1